MKNPTSRTNLLDFAVLTVWIIVCIILASWSFLSQGEDFGVFYAAAKITLSHGNPYDYRQLSEAILSVDKINNPYYYAPWFTWSILPLGLLPYQIARVVWAIINFALWILGLLNLGKLINWPKRGWKRWGIYALATILFAWTTWGFEQVGIIIFFLFTVVLLDGAKKRWLSVGIWLALLLFKPNITALPVATMCVWFLLSKNWKPVLTAGTTVIALTGISLIITPGWYLALLQPDKLAGLQFKFNESGTMGILRYRTTLMDWLAAYQVTGNAATIIYGLTIAVAFLILIITLLRSRSLIHVTTVAILINFIIVPYALYYDYPPLVLTLFYANERSFRKPMFFLGQCLLNILVLASLFLGATISFRYWITVFIASLMALRLLADRNKLEDENSRQT